MCSAGGRLCKEVLGQSLKMDLVGAQFCGRFAEVSWELPKLDLQRELQRIQHWERPEKGAYGQHQGFNLNHFPGGVDGNSAETCLDHDPDQLHHKGEVQGKSFLWVPRIYQPLTRAAACGKRTGTAFGRRTAAWRHVPGDF